MKYQLTRGRLLATSMIVGVATLAGFAANAQTTAAAPAQDDNSVEAVVVTGSLLRRTDTATPSPVTVQTQESLKAQGITTVADAIRSLSADNSGSVPAAFGNGFAAGSTGVALRGLTVNSTLVLVDGLRNASYPLADDGQRSFVDLNSIPFNAVERIETLKDGASSLYGADAIGGVVNIIMKSNYQGMGADLSVGTSQHGGGDQYRFNGDIGYGDLDTDKYNVYFDVEYQLDKRIRINQRGYPYNTFDLSGIPGGTNDNPGAGGSTFYGQIKRATMGTPGDISTGLALDGALWQPLRTCASDAPLTTSAGGAYCAQNTGLFGDVQPKQERIGTYGRFTVKPNDNFQAYLAASFVQSKTSTTGAPRTISSSTPHNLSNIVLPALLSNGQLNPNNPFAAEGYDALIRYRFSDIANTANYTNRMMRLTGGVEGSAADWNYRANVVIAHGWLESVNNGFISYNALMNAVKNGTYNFIDPSKNSQAVRDALAPALAKTSTSDLDSINFQASRDVFNLPGGPAQLGVGGEFRYEAVNDPALNPVNDAQGLGNARTIGNRTVASAFAELGMPVLNNLEVNVSGRYDHYSDFGGNLSPKIGVKYTPIQTVALRATVSKGFRAPSFSESGNSASQGFTNFSFANYPDFIAAHGGSEYTKTYSLSNITVANPNLKPEKSTSYTFGAVWAPTRSFSISLDYYNIKKNDVIAQASSGEAIAAYYAGKAIPAGYTVVADLPDPDAPSALPRILSVASPYINADSLRTSGMDLNIQNTMYLPADIKWTSNLDATVLFDFKYTQGGTTYNYVGKQAPYVLSSGAGTPKYRASWSNTFTRGPFTTTGALNYVSGLRSIDESYVGDQTCLYGGADFKCHTKDFISVNLTGGYDVNDHTTVYADVLNLFDVGPMFNPANYAAVNWNPTYSQSGAVGRYFRMGVRLKY
uniref:TonB-dependent receptor n=1 Tax=uncultured Caulobacter sp. TaxID=158749 RepID=UPI0025FBB815|nr:TonB-dependent receptor [uncultured Caulobacter sp.]